MSQVGWPVAADYDEAIQNPHINFDDPELKSGEPEYDKYGSPAVRSGNFASVYMLHTTNRKVAVRCFLREVPDQQERYAAISKDLLGLGLPYTVNFTYLEKGIRVQGNWFPILKMDWCDGQLLDEYLESNLNNSAKLNRLADKWYEMSVVLRKQGIAHGDLQHGNVMVLNDELQLIDYDGMFVPRLMGRRSNERGLEHYQHPGRTDEHFGRYLDNFSNWVIYTTILSLAEDPKLWKFVNLQDKHLLFNKTDFERPHDSRTFFVLKGHDNHTIRTYATTVENILLFDVEKIPDLNPDKPVMYPPQDSLRTSASQVAVQRQSSGDKGNLFSERGGDKGGLYSSGSDKGGLSDLSRDKGGLAERGGDKGNLHEQQGRLTAKQKVIISVAALLIIWVPLGWFLLKSNGGDKPYGGDPVKMTLSQGLKNAKENSVTDARSEFQKVIDNPDADKRLKSEALTGLGLTYFQEATTTHDERALRQARNSLEQAVEKDPDNANAWFCLGRINEATGRKAEAASAYSKAAFFDRQEVEYASAAKNISK